MRRWLLSWCLLLAHVGTGDARRPLPAPKDRAPGMGAGQLSNITGTYRGTWNDRGSAPQVMIPALEKRLGVVVFQLKSSVGERAGVHNVEGDLVLRAGSYINSKDTQFKLKGVYVVDSARLHAVARPSAPLEAAVHAREADAHTADYRQALRQVAQEWAVPERGAQPTLQQLLAATGAATAGRQKACEFILDLSAADAAANSGDSAVRLGVTPGMPAADALEAEQRRVDAAFGSGGDSNAAAFTARGKAAEEAKPVELVMNGTLVSRNCGVDLAISAAGVQIEKYYAKAVNYTLMMTAISFFQILLLIRQMEATGTAANAAKLSPIMIGQQAIIDAYMCLAHLTAGIMIEPLFNNFATAAFFEFVVFAIFEMRFLLTVWRARRAGQAEPWQVQREMSFLYARFYGALLAGILLATWLHNYATVLVFALYSFWVPQILSCVVSDARQGLRPAYVTGMSALRLALPLYVYACPHNLLRVAPRYGTAAALTAFVAAQAGLLLAQHFFGPRCFVPKFMLPPKYDYYRPLTKRELAGGAPEPPASRSASSGAGSTLSRSSSGGSTTGDSSTDRGGVIGCDEETGHGSVECVICMNPVDVTRLKARMVAPCGHCFHPACLQRWMDVKMECPTCRRPLPQP